MRNKERGFWRKPTDAKLDFQRSTLFHLSSNRIVILPLFYQLLPQGDEDTWIGMWWPCRVWCVSGSYRHERVSNLFVFHQTSHEFIVLVSLSLFLQVCGRQILAQMGVTQEIIKSLSLQNAKVRERLMDFKIKNEISNGFISGQDFLFQCKLCFSRHFIENLRARLLTTAQVSS